jgi:hypothetical protein
VTYGFEAGHRVHAVMCCAVAVLCCKTLVRETSERARPAVLCLPQLLGQPRDARRLNAYAGRTRLPILRSRTLSTRFILSSRFSGPKQIFCCPRSHLFSILLPSPRQATVPQPAREIGERPAYPARSHRLPVSTLHSARLVSALRRCPSSRQTQPVPAGRCSTIPGSRLGPHTHTRSNLASEPASEQASKQASSVGLPTPYAKHAATRSAELAVSSPLVPVQHTNQRLQRVNSSSIFRLLSALLAIHLCTQPHTPRPRHDHYHHYHQSTTRPEQENFARRVPATSANTRPTR